MYNQKLEKIHFFLHCTYVFWLYALIRCLWILWNLFHIIWCKNFNFKAHAKKQLVCVLIVFHFHVTYVSLFMHIQWIAMWRIFVIQMKCWHNLEYKLFPFPIKPHKYESVERIKKVWPESQPNWALKVIGFLHNCGFHPMI